MSKCETGCNRFYGGEVKHVKECVFYKGSLSEMYDKLKDENKELKKSIQEFRESIDIWKAGGYSNYDLEKVTDNIVILTAKKRSRNE